MRLAALSITQQIVADCARVCVCVCLSVFVCLSLRAYREGARCRLSSLCSALCHLHLALCSASLSMTVQERKQRELQRAQQEQDAGVSW